MVELERLKMGKHLRISIVVVAVLLIETVAQGQLALSGTPTNDSSIHIIDTLQTKAGYDSLNKKEDSVLIKKYEQRYQILKHHPYFNFSDRALPLSYKEKQKTPGKELYFYGLAVILLLFALFRSAFSTYFEEFTTLFFKRTLKHRQLQQKLTQTSLPAFVFNTLFIIIGGCYLALAIDAFNTSNQLHFSVLAVYTTLALAVIYIGKFLILKLAGWMFQLKSLTEAYIFLVFLVNKVIALFLLPLIIAIALGAPTLQTIAWTISWILLLALYVYRFVVAFGFVRKEATIGIFHFFLYLLAFELIPVLVIYKVALSF